MEAFLRNSIRRITGAPCHLVVSRTPNRSTMSDRSAPIWPAEHGREPGWWTRVRSAYGEGGTTLDLHDCGIGRKGGRALVERGLPCLPQLTNLNLGADYGEKRNNIGPEGAQALATQGLPHVTQLTSLNLRNNRSGPEGAQALATQGLPHVTQLTSLDLGGNSIGDEGATALATQGLPHVTQLTSLNLRFNRIGDEGAQALTTQGLPHVTQLTSLNLELNDIGAEGAQALATQGLPHVKQLTGLDLRDNSIGEEGAKTLATQGLHHVTQLTSLNLSWNSIGSEGATALATQGLPHVTQLTSLDLERNRIGDEGATALATQGLPHVAQLTSLDLGYNSIGDEGAKALAESAAVWCEKLDELYIVIPWNKVFDGSSSSLADCRRNLEESDLRYLLWISREDVAKCSECFRDGVKEYRGRSFFAIIVEGKRHQLLRRLLDDDQLQPDLDALEQDGHSLLSLAVLSWSPECTQLLLEHGAKLTPDLYSFSSSSRRRDKSSMLHEIVRRGSDEMLEAALSSLLSGTTDAGDDVFLRPGASDLVEVLLASDGSGRVVIDELCERVESTDSTFTSVFEALKNSQELRPFLKRVPLFPPRLHICGPGGAGKTLLRHQILGKTAKARELMCKTFVDGRTRGVEIERGAVSKGGILGGFSKLVVHLFDHGGQQEFQVSYSSMLTQPLSIFVLVIPVDATGDDDRKATTPAEAAAELQYWLSLLETVAHGVHQVVVVANTFAGTSTRDRDNHVRQLRVVMRQREGDRTPDSEGRLNFVSPDP
eukprot:scaffold1131_cov229-Pinguiococcus_pyrenoidosus.AAC.5